MTEAAKVVVEEKKVDGANTAQTTTTETKQTTNQATTEAANTAEGGDASKVLDQAQNKSNTETVTKVEYPTHEDSAVNSVLSLLQDAQLSPDEANTYFLAAAKSQKMEDIDWAGLEKKIGAGRTNLAKLALKDYFGRNIETRNAKIKAVYDVMGGEDNWITVRTWLKGKAGTDKAIAAKIKEAQQAFDLNPTTASAAAKELMDMYNKDPNNSSLTKNVVEGDSSAAAGGINRISRADYQKQYSVAEKKRDFAEMKRLDALRSASIKAGFDVQRQAR